MDDLLTPEERQEQQKGISALRIHGTVSETIDARVNARLAAMFRINNTDEAFNQLADDLKTMRANQAWWADMRTKSAGAFLVAIVTAAATWLVTHLQGGK